VRDGISRPSAESCSDDDPFGGLWLVGIFIWLGIALVAVCLVLLVVGVVRLARRQLSRTA
jgi:hypothetical protein